MNGIPLKMPTKVVQAFALPDIIWEHDAGPMENIFRWLDRGLIVFSGGTLSLIMLACTALGFDLQSLGKMIDEELGLKDVADLTKVNSDIVTSKATGMLWDGLQRVNTTSNFIPPLFVSAAEELDDVMEFIKKHNLDKEDEWQPEKFENEEELKHKPATPAQMLQKQKFDRSEQWRNEDLARERQEKLELRQKEEGKYQRDDKMRAEERRQKLLDRDYLDSKERARLERDDKMRQESKEEVLRKEELEEKKYKDRMKAQNKLKTFRMKDGKSFMGGAGKAALGVGLGSLIAWVFKSLTDPKSWIARTIRGAGAIGTEHIGHPSQETPSTSPSRAREENSPQSPKSTYKNQLEQVVEQIFK